MTEPDVIEPMRIDADLWSHRDLLERIVQRWFHIIEEMQDVEIGWEVTLSEKQENADTALNALNRHLRGLSWIAVLQEGNPYDLIILPEPPRGLGLSNAQTSVIWTIFTFFLTLAGAAWLQLQDPELKLTDCILLRGYVDRWTGAAGVCGLPGGVPLLSLRQRHSPDPRWPQLLFVGDYLYDSTLCGALDAVRYAVTRLSERVESQTGRPAVDLSEVFATPPPANRQQAPLPPASAFFLDEQFASHR